MRENQQNQNLARPGMMAANRFMQANMRQNIMNGQVPREIANKMSVLSLVPLHLSRRGH
jgi:hypothetical protein